MLTHLALVLPFAAIAVLVPTARGASQAIEGPDWAIFDPGSNSATREIHYGLAEGLPELNVIALETGPDGRLWIATSAGLTIFDGVEFSPPRHRTEAVGERVDRTADGPQADGSKAGRSPGLANEYVYALHRDRRGRVWASTEQGSLRCYEDDRVRDLGTSERLGWAPYLAESRDGAIWAGGRGLVRVTDEGITQVVAPDAGPFPTFVSLAVPTSRAGTSAATSGGQGVSKAASSYADESEIWLASNIGIFRWTQADGLQQLDKKPSTGMFFDASGRRWVLRYDAIELDGLESEYPGLSLSNRLISAIPIDANRTLVVLDGASLIFESVDGKPVITRFGEAFAYTDAHAGENGSLWLAEASGGLRFVCPKGFTEIPVPYAGQKLYGLRPTSDERVAFAASTSTGLWTARPTQENPAGTPIEAHALGPGENSPPLLGIFDVHLDANNRGWLATRAGVMAVSNGTTRRLSKNGAQSRAKGQSIQMSSGSLWATDGDQLAEFTNQRTGRSIPLVHPILSCLVQDGDDILAFHAEQIVRYSTQELTSTVEVELPGTLFGSLHVAKTGELWIGTDGNGIYRRRVDGTLDQWSETDGLPTRYMGWIGTVPGPTEDSHLWVSSSSGVISLPLTSLDAVAENREELLTYGFIEAGPSLGGAGVALANGLLVLPTIDGPISIDTRSPIEIPEAPSVSIGEIRANDELLVSETDFVGPTSMTFKYRASQFPFRPTSIVEYRLENHEDDWVRAGRDRQVRYAGLPPGRYRFQVRARSAGSKFGPIATSRPMTVVPRWHQRGLVRTGALLALLGSVVTFFRRRTKRLLDQRSLLESEVTRRREAEEGLLAARAKETEIRRHLARAEEAERSRIARELHDDMSQRLAAVSMGLRATSNDLEGTIEADQDAALKESLAVIESLASDVHILSRQLHPAVLDDLGLSAALRSECQRRRSLMSARISLDDSGAPGKIGGEVGLALFRVAQESLQNASKHAEAEHVRVSLAAEGPRLVLRVEDDGHGFDIGQRKEPGLGLSSMRERMALVGGQLRVTSGVEGGTSVVAAVELSGQNDVLTPQRPPANAPDRARRTSRLHQSGPAHRPSPPDRSHPDG